MVIDSRSDSKVQALINLGIAGNGQMVETHLAFESHILIDLQWGRGSESVHENMGMEMLAKVQRSESTHLKRLVIRGQEL